MKGNVDDYILVIRDKSIPSENGTFGRIDMIEGEGTDDYAIYFKVIKWGSDDEVTEEDNRYWVWASDKYRIFKNRSDMEDILMVYEI